jgi:hypothetical protein
MLDLALAAAVNPVAQRRQGDPEILSDCPPASTLVSTSRTASSCKSCVKPFCDLGVEILLLHTVLSFYPILLANPLQDCQASRVDSRRSASERCRSALWL